MSKQIDVIKEDLYQGNAIAEDEQKIILSALKLKELVMDMENSTGRSLVDVQNWLSKDGKKFTEMINKVLRDLLKESQNTKKELGEVD